MPNLEQAPRVVWMMKLSLKEMQSLASDLGPDDGLNSREIVAHEPRERSNRKTLQLCGEVARTLNAVLAGECGDDLLRDVTVVSVVPAPHSARLLVTVSLPEGVPAEQVLLRLDRARGKLRSEVAAAVRRRRAPELVFRLLGAGA